MPTALICSDEFGPLGRAEAQVLSLPTLPLIAIPHPLAGNEAGLVQAKAIAIADEVVSALTASAASIDARYAASFLSLTERRLDSGAICIDDVCVVDPALSRTS